MPSRRFILLLASLGFFALTVTFTSLHHGRSSLSSDNYSASRKTGLRALFSFTSPSSLFPPSAIISLTDDNSTFFVARLAAFGPLLSSHGLSGQLWVGSGFGDDGLLAAGAITRAEGELGCSDIPGWVEGEGNDSIPHGNLEEKPQRSGLDEISEIGKSETPRQGRRDLTKHMAASSGNSLTRKTDCEDGTDDHLHFPLRASQPMRPRRLTRPSSPGLAAQNLRAEHADIQSIQESAEIAGKVVMLSRGGCGFLEKVKWAQRRGGIALIVGDNTRGGPLLTMGANGDTSNVTIPSLFTSHTTAHLLSSLIPPGGLLEDLGPGDRQSSIEEADTPLTWPAARKDSLQHGPTFTTHARSSKPTMATKPRFVHSSNRKPISKPIESGGWLASVASRLGLASNSDPINLDNQRAPSSGRVQWFISEDWNDDQPVPKDGTASSGKTVTKSKQGDISIKKISDDFVIGVHDWRDPDLVGQDNVAEDAASRSKSGIAKATGRAIASEDVNPSKPPPGGTITPESGEYGPAHHEDTTSARLPEDTGRSWLSRLTSGSSTDNARFVAEDAPSEAQPNISIDAPSTVQTSDNRPFPSHSGLWVTMTPTPASSSPFFDTLLVLVVSPLVTLTVVYALLIIRSRIRRRRWRAPKSVVDRLPVRTYYTMPATCDSTAAQSNSGSERGSPVLPPLTPSGNTTATSPLLLRAPAGSPTGSGSVTPRVSRARSRTAVTLSEGLAAGLGLASAMLGREGGEKTSSAKTGKKGGTGGKKKGYAGRQLECVICLEDYVHGESRVMRLPCGHEFHAECITPWLTTRRRTCPICKGDVVRSLTDSSSPSSSTRTLSPLDSADHEEAHSSAAIPVPRANDSQTNHVPPLPVPRILTEGDDGVDPLHPVMDFDLERGNDSADASIQDNVRVSRNGNRPVGLLRSWYDFTTGLSISAFGGERNERDGRAGAVDRDR